jgi:hypothetical protein
MRKLKLETYELQSRKRELANFLSIFYSNDLISEKDVIVREDTNQNESLEKLKQENLKEKIKILEKVILENRKAILENIKDITLKEVGDLVVSQRGKQKDSEDINFFIDNLFKPLDKLLDKLELNEKEMNELDGAMNKLEKNINFVIAIYYIIQDFINLTKKLSIIKLYGKKSTNVIIKSLNKVITKNKDKKSFNVKEQIVSLFSLTDRNFNEIDEITNNPKYNENQIKEIFELAEQMLNGELMINDELKIKEEMLIKAGMLKTTDKQEYKVDKISIIECIKEKIDFHIKQSQTVTFEDIKNHTINSIIFYYKDYYNIRIAKENLNKLEGKNMYFLLLIKNLKLHRKKKKYLFIHKLNEDDFKILEPYLIFDNFTILDYSTKSFLGRKLMTFFDNPENQSGEFKRVKENLITTKEMIKQRKNTYIS